MSGSITQAVCNSFKQEVLQALHNFTASTGNTFNIALFTATASIAGTYGAASTAYSNMTTDETSGTGYTSGGMALTSVTPALSSGVAVCNFSNVTWSSASITSRGAMIYNVTNGNRAVCILDFGADKTASNGNFTIQFPSATSTTAILRIG